jgi:hypothetical protein
MSELEHAVETAIRYASSRGGRLGGLTVAAPEGVIPEHVQSVLATHGLSDIEIRFERGHGPVRLVEVEVAV